MTTKSAKATVRRIVTDPPRSVALIGFGDSMHLMYELPDDIEIWTLNAAEDYDFPRIDRLFELHPLRDVILETPRWKRLQEKQPYPIYMLDRFDGVPSSVRYPIEAVKSIVYENVFLKDQNAEYFDSTLPYMLALAVLEGFTTIHVYGFGLRSDTEYRYQRPGAMGLIMWAAGRGVKIIMPEKSQLLPDTLYGYSDYQSISRQNCEQWLRDMQMEESDWMGKMNVAHTKVIERQANGASPEKIKEAEDERVECFRQMYMRAGAIHLLLDQISIMDRKQEAMSEMVDPFIEFAPLETDKVPAEDPGNGA